MPADAASFTSISGWVGTPEYRPTSWAARERDGGSPKAAPPAMMDLVPGTGYPSSRSQGRTEMARARWKKPAHEVLRVPEGFRLEALDPTSTPGWKGGAKAAVQHMAKQGVALADLQERLYADGKAGGHRSVLIDLQGMETDGKSGKVGHGS